MKHDTEIWRHALGRYRGAIYSRTWLTMLTGMTLAWLFLFSIAAGDTVWIALIPVTVAVIAPLWLVPLSVVSTEGIRLVLKGIWIPWSGVDSICDPRPGDEEVRLILVDAHSIVLPGVPPSAVPGLRGLLTRSRR